MYYCYICVVYYCYICVLWPATTHVSFYCSYISAFHYYYICVLWPRELAPQLRRCLDTAVHIAAAGGHIYSSRNLANTSHQVFVYSSSKRTHM